VSQLSQTPPRPRAFTRLLHSPGHQETLVVILRTRFVILSAAKDLARRCAQDDSQHLQFSAGKSSFRTP
jgi:hypothetical protein